jgi:hypothetical protein
VCRRDLIVARGCEIFRAEAVMIRTDLIRQLNVPKPPG